MADRTVWTRLEPRPRSDDMADGLRAPVRDPLWMLSRQWQVSEFQGEDAGSPVRADLAIAEDELSRIDLCGGDDAAGPVDYDGGPLETIVEREAVLTDDDPPLRLRAAAGQQFRRTLAEAGYGEYAASDFPDALVLNPPDEALPSADRRYVELMAGRVLDGTAVARAIRSAVGNIDAVVAGEASSWSGISTGNLPLPNGGARDRIFDACVEDFYEWYVDLYDEPTTATGSAWDPTRLEYRFAVATGRGSSESVFEAPGYRGGKLDWYAFSPTDKGLDSDEPTGTDGGQTTDGSSQATAGSGSGDGDSGQSTGRATEPGSYPEDHPSEVRRKTVLPTHVSFPGMPAPRWWEFEEGDTDLSEVTADGTSLSRLLLTEFATQYGNDWYQVPIETPIGTLSRITDLTVVDTFGITETASAALEPDWQLFMHDLPGHESPGLFVPPTLADSVTGDPVERVVFARDEMANLAFGIERTVQGPTGRAIDLTEFQEPQLVVDRVSSRDDPDDEYVQLANPGEDRLFIDGYAIEADMGDSTRTVHTVGQRRLGPGETFRLYTGQADDADAIGAGLSTSVWSPAEALLIRDASGELVAKKLLSRQPDALADYRLSTDVPSYWFPFTPEENGGDRLERALLLDAESLGLPLDAIPRPRGEILTPEESLLPDGEDTYKLYGEEVTRSGREVTRRPQFARWTDGASHLWLSRESQVGDTQLASGLRFDILEERE